MMLLGADALRALPVFPLPRTVFFPATKLALHLFEPRYRAMMRDCVERGPQAMAVTLLRPGWDADYEGRPPMCTIAGAGRICSHTRNADGTYDVLLEGVARVSLEELPANDLPYRRARAVVLEDGVASRPISSSELSALLTAAASVVSALRRGHPTFELGVEPGTAPARIADVIADRLIAEPGQRQALLEMLDPVARIGVVTSAVVELLGMVAGGSAGGGSALAH